MKAHFASLLVVLSVGTVSARAQHGSHQTPGIAPTPTASNPACADAGRKALALVEAADAALQRAPRATSEDTLTDVQSAVQTAQAQLFVCRAAVSTPIAAASPASVMAGMDHSKMGMGKPASTAEPTASRAKPTDAMAGMDHSKMNMGKPASPAKPTARGAKPAAKPADAMAGMDHSKMNMGKPAATAKPAASAARKAAAPAPGPWPARLPTSMAERVADPACPGNVGQATAPKTVYERKVYYFCSLAARDEFRKDPGAYLKKHPR